MKTLLLFVHGFMGNESSFKSFPLDLVHDLRTRHSWSNLHVKVLPKFETKGNADIAIIRLYNWLLLNASFPEFTTVVLLGHSMGGMIALDATRKLLQNHKLFSSYSPFQQENANVFASGMVHVSAILTFDTPFYGLSPSLFSSTMSDRASSMMIDVSSYLSEIPGTASNLAALGYSSLSNIYQSSISMVSSSNIISDFPTKGNEPSKDFTLSDDPMNLASTSNSMDEEHGVRDSLDEYKGDKSLEGVVDLIKKHPSASHDSINTRQDETAISTGKMKSKLSNDDLDTYIQNSIELIRCKTGTLFSGESKLPHPVGNKSDNSVRQKYESDLFRTETNEVNNQIGKSTTFNISSETKTYNEADLVDSTFNDYETGPTNNSLIALPEPSRWDDWMTVGISTAAIGLSSYYSGAVLTAHAAKVFRGLVLSFVISKATETKDHLRFLYPIWGESKEQSHQRIEFIDDLHQEFILACFYIQLDNGKTFIRPPFGSNQMFSLDEIGKETEKKTSCISEKKTFTKIGSDCVNEISAHIHMFDRVENSGHYWILLDKTSKMISNVLKSVSRMG